MFQKFNHLKIGILTSGNLGYKVLTDILQGIKPEFIATDSSSSKILERGKFDNIPVFKGNPRNGRLSNFIGTKKIDLIFSINYLFLIEEDVFTKANYIINFHGSLLPKYRGRTPHVWAIINNEEKAGVTAHLVDENCDSGDIILQREIQISKNMTGSDVLRKYEEIYPEMLNEILKQYKRQSINTIPQDNEKATYFGKRTPDDGEINWEWQKDQIHNWVRAQAYPYPGAFTYLDKQKVIVDKVNFSEIGFNQKDPNGLILKFDKDGIVVKCANGAVSLTEIRNKEIIKELNPGKILGK